MPPQLRRENVHTFADTQKAVYTVIHVPDEFVIPDVDLNDNAIDSVSLQFLRRPHRFSARFPELAYLLRSDCAHDTILSRLALDESSLRPIKYARNEWGLAWKIRDAWRRLEIGLAGIAGELINASSQDRESVGMRPFEYWPDPSDFHYRDLHATEVKARAAIRQARQAFFLLAARCSMAIAIWVKNSATAHSWISWLESHTSIDPTWLDALQHSVIARFAPGLRVGVFVVPLHCEAVYHLPVFVRSYIPLFIRWKDKATLQQACLQYPFLEQWGPAVPADGASAYFNPPVPQRPNVFLLFHQGIMYTLPPSATIEPFKPVGPFQRPGETSREFIIRMEAQAEASVRNETDWQRARRLRRLARADPDEIPPPWIRVYLWMKARDLDSDIRPQWADLDIRVLVPPGAVPGLWCTHQRSHKYYHYLSDSWDLGADVPSTSEIDDSLDLAMPMPGSDNELNLVSALSVDLDFIYRPRLYASAKDNVVVVSDSIVEDYYGLSICTSTFPNVDYLKHVDKVERFLGLGVIRRPDRLSLEARTTYAGFIWAALNGRLYSDATRCCWDLDPRADSYLLAQAGLAERVYRITHAPVTDASPSQLYFLQYHADKGMPWLLAARADVVIYLLQRTSVATSVEAAVELMNVGLPFYTLFLAASVQARSSFDLGLPTYVPPTYRHAGFTPSHRDYQAYELRVMELLQRPHIRAGLMRGGIVWRIAMDIMGYDNELAETMRESVVAGPSDSYDAHASLVKAMGGIYYVNDVLNREEEEVFAGVFQLYTEQRGQTESVSWWPRQQQWKDSGMDTGIWSAWNESWFQRRITDIKEGRAGLINTSGWKSALTMYRPTQWLQDKLQRACEDFLE